MSDNDVAVARVVAVLLADGPRTRLVLTQDNHNSVNGIREFARSRGAITQYVPFCSPELRVERFLAHVEMTYRDRVTGTDGLVPRRGC